MSNTQSTSFGSSTAVAKLPLMTMCWTPARFARATSHRSDSICTDRSSDPRPSRIRSRRAWPGGYPAADNHRGRRGRVIRRQNCRSRGSEADLILPNFGAHYHLVDWCGDRSTRRHIGPDPVEAGTTIGRRRTPRPRPPAGRRRTARIDGASLIASGRVLMVVFTGGPSGRPRPRASILPSAQKATALTKPALAPQTAAPLDGRWPRTHSRTVWSAPPEASILGGQGRKGHRPGDQAGVAPLPQNRRTLCGR